MMEFGEERPCTKCSAMLQWTGTSWHGKHDESCPIARSKQANEVSNALRPMGGAAPHLDEVGLEDVIGPNGAQLWEVTASTGRTIGGEYITDTFRVRADSYDGAMLLAREVRPYIRDADAVKLDG